MSRARDTFRYQPSDENIKSGRAVAGNRTISYGHAAALVAAAIVIVLTIAFWAF